VVLQQPAITVLLSRCPRFLIDTGGDTICWRNSHSLPLRVEVRLAALVRRGGVSIINIAAVACRSTQRLPPIVGARRSESQRHRHDAQFALEVARHGIRLGRSVPGPFRPPPPTSDPRRQPGARESINREDASQALLSTQEVAERAPHPSSDRASYHQPAPTTRSTRCQTAW